MRPANLDRLLPPGLCLLLSTLLMSCSGSAPYRPISPSDFTTADGWIDFGALRYKGALHNGRPNGPGEVIYSSGIRVSSTFVNGVASGVSTVTVPNWGTVEGLMSQGSLVSGHATLANGDEYTGGFRNWLYNGTGTLYRSGGVQMHGTFVGGALNGDGFVFNTQTNTLTEGRFVNGAPEGEAFVYTGATGSQRHYSAGRDVTTDRNLQTAVEDVTRPLVEGLQERETAIQTLEGMISRSYDEQGRLEATPENVDRFNRECTCVYAARIEADGTLRFQRGATETSCLSLILESTDGPPPTAAERRATERARAERERLERQRADACEDWSRDLSAPDLPNRVRALSSERLRYEARLVQERAAREQTAAALRRAQEDARARRNAEVERRLQAIEAEGARRAEARAQEVARTCAATQDMCLCHARRPCTAPRGGCATCQ